jgi:hypothetical protein
MRLILVMLVLLALPFLVIAVSLEPEFLLGGIQVNEPDHGAWMEALERAEMNTVAVTVYAKQGDWDTSNLWFEAQEPWVVAEIRTAKAAGLKVVLVLRVALDHAFSRNRFFWHGMIQPRTEADLDDWFWRYQRFTAQWAAVAEAEGVDVLAVASELNSLTNTLPVDALPALEEYWANPEKVDLEQQRLLRHAAGASPRAAGAARHEGYETLAAYLEAEAAAHREWARRTAALDSADPVAEINRRRRRLEEHWRRVVGEARRHYSGRLSYAANFDQYHLVGFWDALDLIGINAYFPLRGAEVPDLSAAELGDQLAAGWRQVLGGIEDFRQEQGLGDRQVLFTEIGYVARANATLRPWAGDGLAVLPSGDGERLFDWRTEPADPAERTAAMAALRRVHEEMGGDLLSGLLYWKLTTIPAHREVEPFVLVLEEGENADPMLAELARFTDRRQNHLRRQIARLF